MIAPEMARQRMQEADPVPTADDISDDLVAEVLAIIDAGIADADHMAAVQPSGRTTGVRTRRILAVAAAFAVTIFLVGLVGLFRSDEPAVGDPATTLTTVATTVAPETTVPTTISPTTTSPQTTIAPLAPTVPAKPASLEISWERVPQQASLEDGWIAAVAEGESGYVAVGGTVGCTEVDDCQRDAAVWLSDDGTTWERIEASSFGGATSREYSDGTSTDGWQYMNDVARGPAGFVAVGRAEVVDPERPVGWLDRPGIWISADGRQWDPISYDEDLLSRIGELVRVVVFEGRYVAFGEGIILTSTDGVNWERSAVAGTVLDVTVADGLLVAVGQSSNSPAAWVSGDGSGWTAADAPDLMAASGRLQGVGAGAGGLVALGTNEIGRITAWSSADGAEWVAADEYVGDFLEWDNQARTSVTVAQGTGGIDGDLILINSAAVLWGTADAGQTWHRAGEFDGGILEVLAGPAFAVFNTVNQVMVDDDRLLAFGKVVVWSGTEQIGGLCYVDPGGWCRADATIWIGTWDNR